MRTPSEPATKCIYCKGPSPFNDEHVFPAGLGGNDKAFILKNLVCKKCNTVIFSKFEQVLMRNSIVSLSRNLYQPYGRRKGEATVFEPVTSSIIGKDGVPQEAGYKAGFKVDIFPQITLRNQTFEIGAATSEELATFLKTLAERINPECTLIVEKQDLTHPNSYLVHKYYYRYDRFDKAESLAVSTPPKQAIWLKQLMLKAEDTEAPGPVLFSNRPGNLTLKFSETTDIGFFLGALHKALPEIIANQGNFISTVMPQPLVRTTIMGWSPECDRAIAKIAFNFMAFENPEKTRHRSFSKIKRSIVNGHPKLPISLLHDRSLISAIFANAPDKHHVVTLCPAKTPKGRHILICTMLLYGTTATVVTLTDDMPKETLKDAIYYTIDYINNRINRLSFRDYHRIYNPYFQLGLLNFGNDQPLLRQHSQAK